MKGMLALGLVLMPMVAMNAMASSDPVIGKPGEAAKAARTIAVDMSDFMLFTPSEIKVTRGETVLFVLTNRGQQTHEFVLGTARDLRDHAAMMQKNPNMVHEDPGHLTVEPGQKKELAWTFTNSGVVAFACLYPGHYESGMRGTVTVK